MVQEINIRSCVNTIFTGSVVPFLNIIWCIVHRNLVTGGALCIKNLVAGEAILMLLFIRETTTLEKGLQAHEMYSSEGKILFDALVTSYEFVQNDKIFLQKIKWSTIVSKFFFLR